MKKAPSSYFCHCDCGDVPPLHYQLMCLYLTENISNRLIPFPRNVQTIPLKLDSEGNEEKCSLEITHKSDHHDC